MPHSFKILLIFVLLALSGGCADVRVTDPRRTATELFLHSVAARLAVDRLSAEALSGRTIYVDGRYVGGEGMQSGEGRFMLGELRAKLLEADARLVNEREEAQIVVEAYSGGIGVDRHGFLLGIPLAPVFAVAGGTGDVVAKAPDLVVIRNTRQYGTAGVNFVAYWTQTGEVIAHSGPAYGRSVVQKYGFLGGLSDEDNNLPTTED